MSTKNIITILVALCCSISIIPKLSTASLIPMEQDFQYVVYDDVTGYYWYNDGEAMLGLDPGEQTEMIGNLNQMPYYRCNDWRIANYNEVADLLGPMDFDNEWNSDSQTFKYNNKIDYGYAQLVYTNIDSRYFSYKGVINDEDTWVVTKTFLVRWMEQMFEHQPGDIEITRNIWDDAQRSEYIGQGVVPWVVSTTGPSPVPVPSSIILFASCCIGLVGFRKRFKQI